MRRLRMAGLLLTLVFLLHAQQEMRAPSGFYPDRYRGDVFVGDVKSVNKDTQEFTLMSKQKNGKELTFAGVLEAPCDVPSKEKGRKMKVEDIPPESVMAALYTVDTVNRDGAKVRVNSVLAIAFLKFAGQPSKPAIFRCSNEPFKQFKCFDPSQKACLEFR